MLVGIIVMCVCNICMYIGMFCEIGEKEWENDIFFLLFVLIYVFLLINKICFKYICDYYYVYNSYLGLKDVCFVEIDFLLVVFVKFNVIYIDWILIFI